MDDGNVPGLPVGWGVDKDGRDTTDPKKVENVLPMAGIKGAGLSFMIECLTSLLLSEPRIAPDLESWAIGDDPFLNGSVIAIDPGAFGDRDRFLREAERLGTAIAGLARAEGVKKIMLPGDLKFYQETLLNRRGLLKQIRGEFEQVMPELHRKEKRLPDGVEHDLDAAIEALTDLRAGITPSEKIFWRQHKIDRDVAVAFLLDMSGSTGEAIAHPAGRLQGGGGSFERSQRRIIDVEKEAIVLMSDALETIGDRYGVYGFSGHGRDNVEFYVIKDTSEDFNLEIAKRFGRIGPLHATRMGPAIRHTTMKLRQEQSRAKFLFLISDGRPQDRGYSQESAEKAYAVQDTRMALIEARREGIHPFCLTVDKDGNDYLRTMMDDFSYEVLTDVSLLPLRLPQLYRKLTF